MVTALATNNGESRRASLKSTGGRPAATPDKLDNQPSSQPSWTPTPPQPTESKLVIVQITDVYTLANFASVKTMLKDIRAKSPGAKVISVLTGDFLSPYLLSSVDRGAGMMNALSQTPIDYLTWGNHEADIDHRTVCTHVKKFPGTFINTNMQDHEAMKYQKPFVVLEVPSPDGKTQTRKIGLIAVLSNDPNLYKHFPAPGAFGGAKILDPWETLKEYKELLEGPPHNCDLIIPLQHLYVPDDHKTCQMFDFPVILSGHDHHRVDETVCGTRLLKPGLDAVYATVLEICWDSGSCNDSKPKISARFVKTSDWEPDPILEEENLHAYDALMPLRNTELACVPADFRPLSSVNARGSVTTMGKFICSLIKSSLNLKLTEENQVDAVLLMGGNIRGGSDYPDGGFFSLEGLEAEIKSDEVVGIVTMPGWVLAKAVSETHSGPPIPGWMQYDNGVKEEYVDGGKKNPIVTHIANELVEPNKIYRVATKVTDLTNGQSPTLTEYYKANPDAILPKGNYVNIHAELMGYFGRNMWRKIWNAIQPKIMNSESLRTSRIARKGLQQLDLDDDGVVSVDEIQAALRDLAGISVDDSEKSLAQFVHSYADVTKDGQVTLEDFYRLCEEIPDF